MKDAPHGATDPEGEGVYPLIALLAAAVLALVLVTMMRDRDRKEAEARATPAPVVSAAGEGGKGRDVGPLPRSADAVVGQSPVAAAIEEMLVRLVRGNVSAAELAAFKAALLAGPPAETIAAIRAFLATGGNARTGQSFEVAAGGVLSGQPTLRLLLLDVLGQAARKLRSGDAAEVSRAILETKDSPDEWALALRNVAWAEPQSRAYVAGKVREMMAHQAWRDAPSDGMLEALDVAVWTRDATLVPELVEARSANQALSHAVDIALDRMAESAPLDVMTYLNTHPATLAERPLLRADYFAKADLADGAQRSQVEMYLGRPDVAADEKSKLLRALVTPASFVSDTLVTAPPPADDGSARRAALAQATGDWLRTNRFPSLKTQLMEVQERLAP
jgi:hypothetical protein